MANASPIPPVGTTSLSRPDTFPPGRLSVLASLGAATAIVPLPFVPAKLLSAIRGSLIHDVVSRHGLTLTPDARQILAQADAAHPRRAKLMQLANFAAGRILSRLGPLTLLSPAISSIDTFALGILLDRYLETARQSTTVRIQSNEAHTIRDLIDRALIRSLDPTLEAARESRPESAPSEDLRDELTRILDTVLLSTASVPAWYVRRLESAFDCVATETQSARREA